MSFLDWTSELPVGWEAKPLRSTADYVVSNVDKVPADDEVPVRLCNYTDVYNNEFITLALEFMHATASEDEIAKFGLEVDDVIITKDSESWDDIGVPALVRETANDLVCGYHLALLRPPKRKMDGAFCSGASRRSRSACSLSWRRTASRASGYRSPRSGR